MKKNFSLCLFILLCAQAQAADPIPLNPALNEQVLMVPALQKRALFNATKQAGNNLVFRP